MLPKYVVYNIIYFVAEGEEDGCDDLDDDILPEELDDLDEFDSNSDLDSTHLALGLGDALGDTNSLDSHTADLLLPTDIRCVDFALNSKVLTHIWRSDGEVAKVSAS